MAETTRRRSVFGFGVVQLPCADLRPLMRQPAGRLPVPSWPDPVAGREFVRAIGPIRDRPRGSISGWAGERAYCDAAGLIRLPQPDHDDIRHNKLVPCYRRLYIEGVAGRCDVAMTFRRMRRSDEEFMHHFCLEIPVRLPWRQADHVSLGSAGPWIARRLAEATTVTSAAARTDLVVAGSPMVLIEWHLRRGRALETFAPKTRITDEDGFNQAYLKAYPYMFDSVRMPVWEIRVAPWCDYVRLRHLRGQLWRLHTEREALRGVLRAWHRDPSSFNRDALRDYLARQLRLLAQPSRSELARPTLLRFAQRIESLAAPQILDDLRAELRRESRGVLRLLDRVVEQSEFSGKPGYHSLYVRVAPGGSMTVHGDSYQVHGDAPGSAFGPGAHVGDTVSINAATSDAVAASLAALAVTVRTLATSLDSTRAAELAEVHRELEQSVTTTNREPGRIRVAAERLGRFATTVGTVGGPALEAIRKLLEALGVA
jgi:hypothetical protein